MIKINQIKADVIEALTNKVSRIESITGGLGVAYGKDGEHYPLAQKAATTGKTQKGKNIFWVPFKIDQKTIIVCGIKSTKIPKKDITLIGGLITEIKFEYFLKEQVEKFIDAKSDFIKELLVSERYRDFDQAIERGDLLGINLRSPQAVILIHTPGLFKALHQRCQSTSAKETVFCISKNCAKIAKKISAAFNNYDQNITVCIGPDHFVVLKWADGDVNTLNTIKYFKAKGEYIRKVVHKEIGSAVTVGVGQYYPGLAGLKKSYTDAARAVELGSNIWGPGKTYHITDIGMYVSLSNKMSHERKAELANQLLGDILSDKDLHKTVKAFLEANMSLTTAAKNLHLHRNTLIYRLEKIHKEYGLDPRVFSDAVQIKLGLMLFGQDIKKCRSEGQTKSQKA